MVSNGVRRSQSSRYMPSGVKHDGAGLEVFAGRVLKASVVSNPLKNDVLYVVECEIHTFGLTAVSSSPE